MFLHRGELRRPSVEVRTPATASGGPVISGATRWDLALARLDALAVSGASRPFRVLAAVLALNLALLPVLIGAGLLAGDQALFFREGTPGTWLSFVELAFVAVAARAVYLRDHAAFWGLSAAVFLLFAIDEITQAGMFLSRLLENQFQLSASGGFNDLNAALLTLMFAACALLLASRARVLLAHPWTIALMAVGVSLGVASQALDSFATPGRWEFVKEESLKLSAEPFFIAAFLVALAAVLRREPEARQLPVERPAAQ